MEFLWDVTWIFVEQTRLTDRFSLISSRIFNVFSHYNPVLI